MSGSVEKVGMGVFYFMVLVWGTIVLDVVLWVLGWVLGWVLEVLSGGLVKSLVGVLYIF